MSVWLRVADASHQPNLRLAVEGKPTRQVPWCPGRDYYRYAVIGQPPGPGQEGKPIATTWGQYIVQFDDLPLDGLSQMRVRLDLMGGGEVWADDVQLFDLAFNESELRALYKLLTLADLNLQNGQVGDCMKLLNGYWPRFLIQNVPLAAGRARVGREAGRRAAFRRQARRGAILQLDGSREGDPAGEAVVARRQGSLPSSMPKCIGSTP